MKLMQSYGYKAVSQTKGIVIASTKQESKGIVFAFTAKLKDDVESKKSTQPSIKRRCEPFLRSSLMTMLVLVNFLKE